MSRLKSHGPLPDTIRALRLALDEDTATFGRRFASSGRTVEQWETGRRTPHRFIQGKLDELAGSLDAHPPIVSAQSA